MKNLFSILLIIFLSLNCSGENFSPEQDFKSDADFSLLTPIKSNMVIQQNSSIKLYGRGTPDGIIRVSCSWCSEAEDVVIDSDGKWSMYITSPSASYKKLSITIEGRHKLTFSNILSGEVWVCSGQSNMQFPLMDVERGSLEVSSADYPNIRLLNMERTASDCLEYSYTAEWMECTPESVAKFSAIGYLMGKELYHKMNIPIGLINSSWGNTGIEVWTPRESLMQNESLRPIVEYFESKDRPSTSKSGTAYNSMIYPLTQLPIAGVIWYQGENNQTYAYYYDDMLSIMVNEWRKAWDNDFPFYLSAIAPYERKWDFNTNYANPSMRFVQIEASKKINRSGIVLTDDVCDLKDIHPKKKKEVGERFAWMILSDVYGYKDYDEWRSPIFDSYTIENNVLRVKFKYIGNGFSIVNDGIEASEFEICGDDRIFYPAKAKICSDNTIELTSENVPFPKHARLGWSYTRVTNLRSKNKNLPIGVFKTYEWEDETEENN